MGMNTEDLKCHPSVRLQKIDSGVSRLVRRRAREERIFRVGKRGV